MRAYFGCFVFLAALPTQFGTNSAFAEGVPAVLCGKLLAGTTSCAQANPGGKNPVKFFCSSSGRCDDNDKCGKRPGFTAAAETDFPQVDWSVPFRSNYEPGNDFKIDSKTIECWKLINCKSDCEIVGGNPTCKKGTVKASESTIAEYKENGACPPPPPKPPAPPVEPPVVVPPVAEPIAP